MHPGRKARACCRLVSLTSWICMLAVWNRRKHADHEPEVPGSLCGCRSMSILLPPRNCHLTSHCSNHRSTQTAPSQRERSTLVPSGRTRKATRLLTLPHLSISPFLSVRSRTSACTRTNTILWKSRSSLPVSIPNFWEGCGISTGSTR